MGTISHYEILEKLGEGGMGVVWKARDIRLDRFVAIKLLPPDRTADPDRRRRFVTEARAASALNHPHIITIYDIDQSDGADFIAMEYVAGRTLEELIPAKGMKPDNVIRYAIQIADALAAAHAAGIVHRDLKPANVMVMDNGQIKVLDFGLAKLRGDTGVTTEAENTRTIRAEQRTEDGAIVGTISYMSPEQSEGKRVDARSDIFSFGSVLYEMLTGRKAFRGDSKASTLAAILRGQPEPIEVLASGTPRDLVRLVQRCLRKDPDDRAQSMADLRVTLKDLKEESDSGSLPVPGPTKRNGKNRWWIGVAAAVLAVMAGSSYLLVGGRDKAEAPLKATLLTSYEGLESQPSFSPDGNQVAFVWNGESQDNYDIYVKLLGPGKPLRLTSDPARDWSPAWSPDGRWIAFTRNSTSLILISPIGGPERELARGEFPSGFNGAVATLGWTPDSRWVLTSMRDAGINKFALYLISVETGEKKLLAAPAESVRGDYFFGAISPDGKRLAFAQGYLVSWADGEFDIYAAALNSDYSLQGPPNRITSDRALISGLAWTGDGREVIVSSSRGSYPALWRVPVIGSHTAVKLSAGENGIYPAISRDGRRLVFEQSIPRDDNIWRIDLGDPGKAPVSLIASTRVDLSPRYSPDGRKIAFSSERSGPGAIWVCDADGGNAVQLTTERSSGSPWWSPDGQQIAFDSIIDTKWQIFTVSAQGGKPRQITFGSGHSRPSWSHDGRWIYSSTGNGGIQKTPAAGGNPVQLTKDGTNPVESVDGKAVFYARNHEIWKVGVDGAGGSIVVNDAALAGLAVTADGVYYFGDGADAGVRLYRFSEGRSHTIAKVSTPQGPNTITVSPDQKWLLYVQQDRVATGDLMLVDPFH